MATNSSNNGPEFFAGDQSAENMQRRFIEAPLEAAQQSVVSSGLELANLLSSIPEALLASQQRELERVKKLGREKGPQVDMLQRSIEQAGVLRTAVQRGQARAGRALAALADSDSVFHGFVSDAELTPLKGLTVRLIAGKGAGAKNLAAKTEEDGYFRMVLGAKSDTEQGSAAQASPLNLSQRIVNFMSGPDPETRAASAASAEVADSRVEILKNGKVRHRDPVPLSPKNGSVYREYVIGDVESTPASAS